MLQERSQQNHYNDRIRLGCFIIASLAFIAALVLTVLSMMEFCTAACVEGHKYRLFFLKFEHAGLVILTALLISHVLGWSSPFFSTIAGWMLACAVGAELYFIYLQKYIIGHWCPVCLGIASSIFIAASAYVAQFFLISRKSNKEGNIMSLLKPSLPPLSFVVIGIITALIGVAKVDPLESAQASLKESIAFGDPTSPIEVYVFTDWYCPACEAVEPHLINVVPKIEKQAKLFFIDANIHDESMNFTPYNLSFMINNKPEYLKLRKALHKVAGDTKTPTDEQIRKAIKPYNADLKELNYMDIALGNKMFTKLKKQFGVTSTPSVIIINLETKKGKKLKGKSDITEANILKAIDSLKQ